MLFRSGHVDILINSAGINIRGPITGLEPAQFERVMSVNVTGTWLCCRAVGSSTGLIFGSFRSPLSSRCWSTSAKLVRSRFRRCSAVGVSALLDAELVTSLRCKAQI